MGALPEQLFDATTFLVWADRQVDGRYELVGGQVFEMSPEKNLHALVKLNLAVALRQAIERAAAACVAFVDGPSIIIDQRTVRRPDAVVQLSPFDPEAQTLDRAVIVAEVISPNSMRTDLDVKRREYFRVDSICHYLVVDPRERTVIRHSRKDASSAVETVMEREGTFRLDPPGLEMDVADLFAEADR